MTKVIVRGWIDRLTQGRARGGEQWEREEEEEEKESGKW